MYNSIGKSFEALVASYRRPHVKEFGLRDGRRNVSVMETQCDGTCGICGKEEGRYCLLGFSCDTFIINSDDIVIGMIEER